MRWRGISSDLNWLGISIGLWGLGYGLYAVLWPLWVEHLGGGPFGLGLLSTMASLATALVVLPGGYWADRLDRRCLLFWGSVVAVPVPFLFAWAPRWPWLIPGVLLYFGSSFSIPALQAVVVAEAPPERLSFLFNLIMAEAAGGLVAGPALGGMIAQRWSFPVVFYLSGLLYLLSALAILPMRPKPPRAASASGAAASFRPGPALRRWLLFTAALALIGGVAGPFVVPFLKAVSRLSVEQIGILGSVGVLSATLAGPVWGWMAESWGIPRTLGLGFALGTVGWLVLLWQPAQYGWLLWSSVIRGVGEGARNLVGVAVGQVVGTRRAGQAYGFMGLITEGVGALAPLVGGVLYGQWNLAPLLVAAGLTGMVAAWLLSGPPYGPPEHLNPFRRSPAGKLP